MPVAALSACSEKTPAPPPTDQEIHSADSGVPSGRLGRHVYRCDDGSTLLVDFADKGLQLDLRVGEGGRPKRFTAPLQGLQYVGDAGGVVLRGTQLETDGPELGKRICRRQGRG
ncbi:hypothetical protein D9601_17225 [Sphingomonas sp. MA1305]|nr:hypothetical protein [Sphingomonas sp. MA1305]